MPADLIVAALAVVAFLAGALWREALWRYTIGGSLAQVRAKRAATLAPPVEPAERPEPATNIVELRERQRAFDLRHGIYKGRPS